MITDAVTTNAAVIAMRSASVRMKASSGDIFAFSPSPGGVRDERSSLVVGSHGAQRNARRGGVTVYRLRRCSS